MQAHSSQFQFSTESAPVQRLDIYQFMFKTVSPRFQQVLGKGIKHEGIIRIRTMANSYQLLFINHVYRAPVKIIVCPAWKSDEPVIMEYGNERCNGPPKAASSRSIQLPLV
jgi:hypothetical protein